MQQELEKENFIEYYDNAISNIKELLPENKDIIDVNNPEIRSMLLDLIRTIKDLKNNDISFYNSLLKDLPNLDQFSQEVKDLNEVKYFISDCLLSKSNKINTKNFANLMKSSKIYYFINKKTTNELTNEQLLELGDIGLIKEYLKLVWPSAKQEELLGLLLYINSGKATNDYSEYLKNPKGKLKEVFLYDKFRESLHDLHVELDETGNSFVEILIKKQKVISARNKMDAGVILDKENKKLYIGFTTSKYDTSEQKKQFFEKMKAIKDAVKNNSHPLYEYEINSAYITNSLLNENELKNNEIEHKKEFLSYFSNNLTKEEKNKINCLSFLSIIGNITMSDMSKGFDVKDFYEINPYVSGADTLWIYNKFASIKKLHSDEKKCEELRNFLIDEVREILIILDKKLPDFEFTYLNNNFGEVFKNLEKMISASLELFNESNLSKDTVYNEDFVKNIVDVANLYEKVHKNKFNMAMPSNNTMHGNSFYNSIQKIDNVKYIIQKNNKDYISIIHDKEIYIKNKSMKLIGLKNDLKINLPEITNILQSLEINIFSKDNIYDGLEEIISLAKLYPSRPIKKLLGSVKSESYNFFNIKKFTQNYKYWEKNQEISYKNKEKYIISNIILDNCNSLENLKNELIQYKVKYNNQLKKTDNFKSIVMSAQSEKYYNNLKNLLVNDLKNFQINYNISKNQLFMEGKEVKNNILSKSLLVAYLKVKAEIVVEKNYNGNSIKSFMELYKFALNIGLKNDQEIIKSYNLLNKTKTKIFLNRP